MIRRTSKYIKEWKLTDYLLIVITFIWHTYISLTISVYSPVPTAPRNVTASPEGMSESLTISWISPEELNSPSLFYAVNFRGSDSSMRSVKSAEDHLEVVIVGLRPFTVYTVTVEGCSFVGCGPVSMEVSTITLQGGA